MSKAFGGDVTLVDDTFYEEVGKGSGGFLRMGENFRIGSFNTKTPSGNRFELRASSFELSRSKCQTWEVCLEAEQARAIPRQAAKKKRALA
jgi:hypothetical protein